MPSISPGKASTTAVTRRWPSGRSRRTVLPSTLGCTPKRAPMRSASERAASALAVSKSTTSPPMADFNCAGEPSATRVALVQNGQPVAMFGFLHQVGGHQNGDALLVTQCSAGTATCHGARRDRGRSMVRPAAAPPVNGSGPWPARPAVAYRRRAFRHNPWPGRSSPPGAALPRCAS